MNKTINKEELNNTLVDIFFEMHGETIREDELIILPDDIIYNRDGNGVIRLSCDFIGTDIIVLPIEKQNGLYLIYDYSYILEQHT